MSSTRATAVPALIFSTVPCVLTGGIPMQAGLAAPLGPQFKGKG